MEKRICTKCGLEQDITEYLFNAKRNLYETRCRSCNTKKMTEWRNNNRERNRKTDREGKQKLRLKSPFKYRIHNMRGSFSQHAKKMGLPCNVTAKDLIQLYEQQAGKCYYTGLEMKVSGSRETDPLLISCDRIIPANGYIKGNVVLCCWGINAMKSKQTPEEMFRCLQMFYQGAIAKGNINP